MPLFLSASPLFLLPVPALNLLPPPLAASYSRHPRRQPYRRRPFSTDAPPMPPRRARGDRRSSRRRSTTSCVAPTSPGGSPPARSSSPRDAPTSPPPWRPLGGGSPSAGRCPPPTLRTCRCRRAGDTPITRLSRASTTVNLAPGVTPRGGQLELRRAHAVFVSRIAEFQNTNKKMAVAGRRKRTRTMRHHRLGDRQRRRNPGACLQWLVTLFDLRVILSVPDGCCAPTADAGRSGSKQASRGCSPGCRGIGSGHGRGAAKEGEDKVSMVVCWVSVLRILLEPALFPFVL
jgi:hypothetical protein